MTTTTSAASGSASTAAAASTSSAPTSNTNASIGQSILSSLNANGAGIDTDTLITSLTAAQKTSVETPITTKQTAVAAQISSTANIASDLSAFSTSLNTLIQGGTLLTQPTSSDTTTMTVSALAGSNIGNLTGTVVVSALAQAETLESPPVAANTSYGSGNFTLTTTGGQSVSLTAGTDFTDLNSLTTAINAKTATTGVTASVVTDGNGSHLVLKGGTGAAQGFSITATGDASGFGYTPTAGDTATANVASGTGMQRLQVAQDAAFTIDGVSYTRPSNTIADAIPGVKMTLIKTGTLSLGSSRPTDAITQAVNDFVSAYNQLKAELTTATAAATSTSDAGPLRGNSAIRDLTTQLAKLTTTPLNATGNIRTLAELGVQTGLDGTLSVNSTTLSNMLTNYPDDVESMFTSSQSSSASGVLITSAVGASASGVYSLTNITPAVDGGNATGTLDGTPMTASSWKLTPGDGSDGAGLLLQILSSAPGSATITINQGLGGALQAIHDTLLGTSGSLTTLQSSLSTQSSNLADSLTKADAQVQVYHDQLVTKFTQMNTLVSGYKATSSYLTQQVDLWTKSSS